MYMMFELIPVDFASDVSVENAAHAIVRDTVFDGDVADCAVDERSQKKIGEGFGAILDQRRTTRSARSSSGDRRNPGSDTVSSQIEINIFLANQQIWIRKSFRL